VKSRPYFAINHMVAPVLRLSELFDLARRIGAIGVELRNDLEQPLFDGLAAETVGRMSRDRRLRILALSEIKAFDRVTPACLATTAELVEAATACGAEAVSLIPCNDDEQLPATERKRRLCCALREYLPYFENTGITALIEPLGFDSASVRFKADVVNAVDAVGGNHVFRLIHDSFHHRLSGESEVFATMTGLVHVSAVKSSVLAIDQFRDHNRVLDFRSDRLNTIEQLRALQAGGYEGPISFEPFAPEIHALRNPFGLLRRSVNLIREHLDQAVC